MDVAQKERVNDGRAFARSEFGNIVPRIVIECLFLCRQFMDLERDLPEWSATVEFIKDDRCQDRVILGQERHAIERFEPFKEIDGTIRVQNLNRHMRTRTS